MAQPKRKTSKMKKRQRKASNKYAGIQTSVCPECGAPKISHRACPSCGYYAKKQVVTTSQED